MHPFGEQRMLRFDILRIRPKDKDVLEEVTHTETLELYLEQVVRVQDIHDRQSKLGVVHTLRGISGDVIADARVGVSLVRGKALIELLVVGVECVSVKLVALITRIVDTTSSDPAGSEQILVLVPRVNLERSRNSRGSLQGRGRLTLHGVSFLGDVQGKVAEILIEFRPLVLKSQLFRRTRRVVLVVDGIEALLNLNLKIGDALSVGERSRHDEQMRRRNVADRAV